MSGKNRNKNNPESKDKGKKQGKKVDNTEISTEKTENRGNSINFLNPYTFVPFQEKRAEQASWEKTYNSENELLTGWLDIKMELKTPMIIPDSSRRTKKITKNGKEHYQYPFFRLPDENKTLAVPGSSLRGMIRNVYETLTDSCVCNLLDDKPISQRNPFYAGFRKRGLLHYDSKNDTWELYEVDMYRKKCKREDVKEGKYKGFITGEMVKFTGQKGRLYTIKKMTEKSSDKIGWLQFNIPIEKNNNDNYNVAVLKPKGEAQYKWKTNSDNPNTPEKKLLSALNRDGVSGKEKEDENKYPTTKELKIKLQKSLKDKEDNYIPVYYIEIPRKENISYKSKKSLDNFEIYLSGSSIGRVGRSKKWKNIMGEYAPCTKIDSLCPACLLFGTAADGGTKGRLRFTDALPKEPTQIKMDDHTLQILGTPRPSAFEFYLNRPDGAQYWNFDYYMKKENGRAEYYPVKQMMPRGRKYYWNHKDILDDAKSETKMNTTMECVSKGDFGFRIYFDEINPQQLNDIIWSVTLGENTDKSNMYHKIGHGKPLGYGSVKLTVKDAVIRKAVSREDKIDIKLIPVKIYEKIKPAENCQIEQLENKYVLKTKENTKLRESAKNILAVCDSERFKDLEIKYTIRYPVDVKNNEETDIYQWFSKNRENSRKLRTLPLIKDKNKNMILQSFGKIIEK